MGVSGNLKTMLPGDLLQWLSLGQKTGTLTVTKKAIEKRIFFRRGRVISSASNDPREYLGQFLMSHGYMSEPELMKGMQVQAESGGRRSIARRLLRTREDILAASAV